MHNAIPTDEPPVVTRADVKAIAWAVFAGPVIAALVVLFFHLTGLAPDVLKAASGESLIKPTNGGVISDALKTINGNALWIMVTGVGTAVTVVGLALMFGVRDASNWAFRIAGAIVVVFVVGPALVA